MEERLLVPKNEIVVYQPNKTMRLEVRIRNESAWLTQEQIAELFGTKRPAITKHIANIYKSGELDQDSTCSILEHMGSLNAQRYRTRYYNLDVILSVGYRVNSINATRFRQWSNSVLKHYLLQGISVNQRMIQMEDRIDRRLTEQQKSIDDLRKDVDYFISSALPPKEKVLRDGQMLDAQFELTRIVKTARHRIVLIDNYIDERTLMLLGNRRVQVDCTVYTLKPNSPKLAPALANYAKQYSTLPITVKGYQKSHDRFLIIDNTVWHIGASLKDAGSALFALMKMELDPSVILALLP